MTYCYVCPHRCGVNRPETAADTSAEKCCGSCGCALKPLVARAALHYGEEPCISGTRGSGTVFFAHCNLHCVFCQNYAISAGRGDTNAIIKEISVARLKEIYRELIAKGAHNINLVTPTHFAAAISASLDEPLPVPIVYNSSGFECVDTLRQFQGKVQIYLPDLKWYSDVKAIKYSNAPAYFRYATLAIREMYRQTGDYRLDADGIMQSGVIVRHLLLPGMLEETKRIIDWLAETFKPGQVMFSLMRQYVPCGQAELYPEINRTISEAEFRDAASYLLASSIEDGYLQEDAACASKDFIPCFDASGV